VHSHTLVHVCTSTSLTPTFPMSIPRRSTHGNFPLEISLLFVDLPFHPHDNSESENEQISESEFEPELLLPHKVHRWTYLRKVEDNLKEEIDG
jgi:hypothetical protein